jgi:hypothetical protein
MKKLRAMSWVWVVVFSCGAFMMFYFPQYSQIILGSVCFILYLVHQRSPLSYKVFIHESHVVSMGKLGIELLIHLRSISACYWDNTMDYNDIVIEWQGGIKRLDARYEDRNLIVDAIKTLEISK